MSSSDRVLTPPRGWRFAWLDDLPRGASFRYTSDGKDVVPTADVEKSHTLVLVRQVCPTCGR